MLRYRRSTDAQAYPDGPGLESKIGCFHLDTLRAAAVAWSLDRPEIAIFWGLDGPGGRENPFKRWGAKRSTLLQGFPGVGAAQTPNIDDFRSVDKPCLKNPNVRSLTLPRANDNIEDERSRDRRVCAIWAYKGF